MINLLSVKNFKSFGEQEISFSPVTLLSGINGSGKSTIIQSLLLLRQSVQQGFLPKHGLLLNGPLVEIGTARDALYSNAEAEEITFGIKLSDGISASWTFMYDRSADVMQIITNDASDDMYRSGLFSDDFQYLSAERIGPRAAYGMADYAVKQRRQLGPRGEYAAHFLASYGSEEIAIPALRHRGGGSASLLQQTEAWLRLVTPGVRIYVTPFQGIDTVQLEYSFISGNDESNRYRPTNVGFGLTYTLPIIVAILASRPGSIVIIENPESNLHGKGQRVIAMLAAVAAENGVQIIFESHSDHILNGLRIAVHQGHINRSTLKVHFLQQGQSADSGSRVVTPQIDERGRIRGAPEGFFDEWDKSLDELISQEAP